MKCLLFEEGISGVMSGQEKQPQTLSGALRILGGIGGFLWGGTIASEAGEPFLIGALIGGVVGGLAGFLAEMAISIALRLAVSVGSIVMIIAWFLIRTGQV